MTQNKGWGLRCLDDVSKGTFVCVFTGTQSVSLHRVSSEQDVARHAAVTHYTFQTPFIVFIVAQVRW